MEYQATAKYLRVSPRKMRLVADVIRKLTPADAVEQLRLLPKRAGKSLSDVIASALANARTKSADPARLRFKTIEVMGGQVMKRWHAVSRGMAHTYKKRMTHVRVIITDDASISDKRVGGGGK
jgi:large subunit ribosomal protein L22